MDGLDVTFTQLLESQRKENCTEPMSSTQAPQPPQPPQPPQDNGGWDGGSVHELADWQGTTAIAPNVVLKRRKEGEPDLPLTKGMAHTPFQHGYFDKVVKRARIHSAEDLCGEEVVEMIFKRDAGVCPTIRYAQVRHFPTAISEVLRHSNRAARTRPRRDWEGWDVENGVVVFDLTNGNWEQMVRAWQDLLEELKKERSQEELRAMPAKTVEHAASHYNVVGEHHAWSEIKEEFEQLVENALCFRSEEMADFHGELEDKAYMRRPRVRIWW